MNISEKERLSRKGDVGNEAAALRLKAARKYAKLSQEKLGEQVGLTKATISNAENQQAFPSRDVLIYLHRAHRVDFNFMICGDFVQLPGDVQDGLFEQLMKLDKNKDQKSS